MDLFRNRDGSSGRNGSKSLHDRTPKRNRPYRQTRRLGKTIGSGCRRRAWRYPWRRFRRRAWRWFRRQSRRRESEPYRERCGHEARENGGDGKIFGLWQRLEEWVSCCRPQFRTGRCEPFQILKSGGEDCEEKFQYQSSCECQASVVNQEEDAR